MLDEEKILHKRIIKLHTFYPHTLIAIVLQRPTNVIAHKTIPAAPSSLPICRYESEVKKKDFVSRSQFCFVLLSAVFSDCSLLNGDDADYNPFKCLSRSAHLPQGTNKTTVYSHKTFKISSLLGFKAV